MKRTELFVSATCAALALVAQPAVAEEQPSDASAELDEESIVVTARKRAESVMAVPVVATTLDQEQLLQFNTADLKSLATMVPGLSLGSSVLSIGLQASIRGVGTSSLDPGTDASVSLNIDGLSLSQGLAYASGMFDIGSIEVLKGPQALFYGKSSPGGVIALRTADPTDEFEVIARAGYEFEARERRFEAIFSGPISDSLKMRLAGQYGKQDGFFKNPAVAIPALGAAGPSSRRLGPAEDYKLRLSVLFEPSDVFDLRLKLNRAYDFTNYSGTSQLALCPDGVGPVNGQQFVDPNDECEVDRSAPYVDFNPRAFPGIPHNGVPYNRSIQNYGTAELNIHVMPDLTLTSHTGYYVVNSRSLHNAASAGAGMGRLGATNKFQRRQFTQEVRLTSDFSTPLNFTLGGYLERGRFFGDIAIVGNTALNVAPILQMGTNVVRIHTESLFGQALYNIVPEVEIALGARWTNERRTQEGFNTISGTAVPVIPLVPKISSKNWAPELTISYRPNDDLTVFGSLKQAYKSGSFNIATPIRANVDNSFGDERVRGGEIGLKARSADRSLNFNVAGFYYKFSGLQVGANVSTVAGAVTTRTINAGSARLFGVEADVAYRPPSIDGLGVRVAAVWLNSKYTRLANVPCYGGQLISEGCNLLFNPAANGGIGGFTSQDRSGVPLVRAPEFTANFGFDYEIPVGQGLSLTFASNNQYATKQLVNLGYIYYQPAYFKADASVILRGSEDKWEIALIGKNLNNEITTGNCANGNRAGGNVTSLITGSTIRNSGGIDEVACWADRGRELWVRTSVRF